MKPLISTLFFLFPNLVFSQVVRPDFSVIFDTVAVKRQLDSLYKVAQSFARQGDLDKAFEVNAGAEKLVVATLGKDCARYASICFIYGRIYFHRGNAYPEAVKWLLESLTIGEKVSGKSNVMYAKVAGALALAYPYLGQYDKAEHYSLEAMAAHESVSEKETNEYAMNLNNLGMIYEETGQYEKAEAVYLEAKAIRGRVLGTNDTQYAATLNNLAVLYLRLGHYEKSEAYNIDAVQTWERCCTKNDPDYALGLYNLAALYSEMNEVEKALPLAFEAKSIMEKTIGKEHDDYTQGLTVLATLLSKSGRHSEALDYCLEAKSTQERTIGKGNTKYAMTLNLIAGIYFEMGEHEKAEVFYLESIALREKKLGKNNQVYVGTIAELSRLYNDMGLKKKARQLLDEAITIERDLLAKSARHLSERELASYSKTFRRDLDFYFSFVQNADFTDAEMAGECFNNALFYKGFLFMASKGVRRLAEANPVAAQQFGFLKSNHRALAAEYAQPDASQARILDLETKNDSIEKVMARTVAGFGKALTQVTWQQVQDNLKPGEAAVEFVHYRADSEKPNSSNQYAALVLRSRREAVGSESIFPKFIPLFEEGEIARLLAGATGKADQKINALYSPDVVWGGKSLFDLIWKPLESELKGVKKVYCSPTGLLHRLNLAAIIEMANSDLPRQKFNPTVIVLGSTRNLVIPSNVNYSSTDAYLIGGVRYESDTTQFSVVNTEIDTSRGSENLFSMPFCADTATRGSSWKYLPATLIEVLNIRQCLQNARWSVNLDTGYAATEEATRNLGVAKASPRLVHLATHGYFFPDPAGLRNERDPIFKISDHPMLRSGVILASSNDAWLGKPAPTGREDGILTAYEISQMNLSNTELVVLSACETGLGDIEGDEGVYGLQRAFKIAGAKYLIMSLWKVSDKSSHEMMTDFYKQWLEEGLTIPEAFKRAQLNMKVKYPDAPYHWAGFVLVE